MKKMSTVLFASFLLFITSIASFAQSSPSFKVSGFLGVDFIYYDKVEGAKAETEIANIGGADLKVKAILNDKLEAYFKFDLDDGDLSKNYNIMEEAYLTYKYRDNIKFIIGKNKIPFQLMHWGALRNSWSDGVGVSWDFRPDMYWTDIDNKHSVIVEYKSKGSKNFTNSFSIYGDSYKRSAKEESGKITVNERGQKNFDLNERRGFANLFTYYPKKDLSVSLGAVYYDNNLAPSASYAISLHSKYKKDGNEYWAELKYGKGSLSRLDRKSTGRSLKKPYEKQNEIYFQIGTERPLSGAYSFLADFEFANLDRTGQAADAAYATAYAGDTPSLKSMNVRIDTAIKYSFSKSAFWTTGLIVERAAVDIKGTGKTTRYGIGAGSGISYWF